MERLSSSVRKGAWTEEEDTLLKKCIEKYGKGTWHKVPSRAGLNRCRKSCRLRWLNYLNPNIKRGAFADDEVDLIIRLHNLLGNRWSLIAGRLPGRTANDVKNYWNTHLLKKKVDPSSNTNPRLNPSKLSPRVIRPRPQILSKNNSHVILDENKKNNTATAATPTSNNILVSANSGGSRSYCFPNENDEITRWENLVMNENEVDSQSQQHHQGSIDNIDISVLGDQPMPINEELDHSTTSNFQLLEAVEEDSYGDLDQLFLDVDLWNVFNPQEQI